MSLLARLAAALATVVAPVLSLAQEAGGHATPAPRAGFAWLWVVAAALVVVALFRVLVMRDRGDRDRPSPPARHP